VHCGLSQLGRSILARRRIWFGDGELSFKLYTYSGLMLIFVGKRALLPGDVVPRSCNLGLEGSFFFEGGFLFFVTTNGISHTPLSSSRFG